MSTSGQKHPPLPHQHRNPSPLDQSCPVCRAERRKTAAAKRKTAITRKLCASCGEMRWTGSGDLCLACVITDANVSFKKLEEAMVTPESAPLPEVSQDEPVRGLKAAVLVVTGEQHDPRVRFQGTGMSALYDAEAVARCLKHGTHDVPDPACTCGFWLPATVKDVQWPASPSWLLDVELTGRVMECGYEGKPAGGWRGSDQRVLTVSPSRWCQLCAPAVCTPGRYLVVLQSQYARQDEAERPVGVLAVACVRHAVAGAIPFPVTWLRERLGTEVQPGFLTDDEAVVPASVITAEDQALADRLAQLTGASVPGTRPVPVSIPGGRTGKVTPRVPPPLPAPAPPAPPTPPPYVTGPPPYHTWPLPGVTWSGTISSTSTNVSPNDWIAQYWPKQP